jgi:serine/threonine-protein kinase
MMGLFELLILLGVIYALTRVLRSRRFREKFLALFRRVRGFVVRRPLLTSIMLGVLALPLGEKAHEPGHSFATLMFALVLVSAIGLFVWAMYRRFELLFPNHVRRISGKQRLLFVGFFSFGMALLIGGASAHHPSEPLIFFGLLFQVAAIIWGTVRWLRSASAESQAKACPSIGHLKEFLAERLRSNERTELAGHLEGCAACQHRVEGLTAGQRSWPFMARKLSQHPPAPEPALRKLMDRLKEDKEEETRDEPVFAADLPLNFLSPTDKPGQLGRLERYEVLEEIGRGGMGVVLKAFDPSLHRVVAIKVLAPQLATSGVARKRFLREAKAAAAVTHDHIVTIHDVVEAANGLPYLVMHYIAGQSLQQRIDKEGPLDLTEILRIGMQTASGLAAAHGQGIVHRDIKPANILLEDGVQRVKITDFGLARAMDDASLTQSGFVAGSPLYMAPEQARGESLDHRADLFSLGSVLYTMCTGRPPFRAANTLAVLRRVSEDAPRPIRETNPEIPDWLVAVVEKLMAKEPADRYQSAGEVVEALGKHLAQMQHAAWVPPPGPNADLPTSLTICPSCGTSLYVPEEMVGGIVHCAECGKPFQAEDGSEVIQIARAVKPPFGPGLRRRRRLPGCVWIVGGFAAFLILLILLYASLRYHAGVAPQSIPPKSAASGGGQPSGPPPIPMSREDRWNELNGLPAGASLFGAIRFPQILPLDDARTQTLLRLLAPEETARQLTPENLGRIHIQDLALAYYERPNSKDPQAILHLTGTAVDGHRRIVEYLRRTGGDKVRVEELDARLAANGPVCISGPELPFALKIVDDNHAYFAASGARDGTASHHRKLVGSLPASNSIPGGYNPPWIKNAVDNMSTDVWGFFLGEIPAELRDLLTEALGLRVCPRSFILTLSGRSDAALLTLTLNVDKADSDSILRDDLEKWRHQALDVLRASFPALRKETKALGALGQALNSMRWETDRGSVRTRVQTSASTWNALRDLLNRASQAREEDWGEG